MFLSRGVGELESMGTRTVQEVCFSFAGNTKPNLGKATMASSRVAQIKVQDARNGLTHFPLFFLWRAKPR